MFFQGGTGGGYNTKKCKEGGGRECRRREGGKDTQSKCLRDGELGLRF